MASISSKIFRRQKACSTVSVSSEKGRRQALSTIISICILQLTEDTVFDVLCLADLYLLPGLKRHCANCISKYIAVENVVQILLTARLYLHCQDLKTSVLNSLPTI